MLSFFRLAVELCKQQEIELIIADIIQPGKIGLDLILQIKKQYLHIPVITVSDYGDKDNRYDFLKLAERVGSNNILKKPFNASQLLQSVMHTLKIQH